MTQLKGWLNANGRKESTVRLYLYQIHTLYKEAEKEAIAPHLPLLSGIKPVSYTHLDVYKRQALHSYKALRE